VQFTGYRDVKLYRIAVKQRSYLQARNTLLLCGAHCELQSL